MSALRKLIDTAIDESPAINEMRSDISMVKKDLRRLDLRKEKSEHTQQLVVVMLTSLVERFDAAGRGESKVSVIDENLNIVTVVLKTHVQNRKIHVIG